MNEYRSINIISYIYEREKSMLCIKRCCNVSHKSYRCYKLGRTFSHNDPYLIYHNIASLVDAIELEIIMHQ